MKYTYIYCLRFRSTQFYIGRTRNLKHRFQQHKKKCFSKNPSNPFMSSVWKKYGDPEIYILAKVPVHLEEQEEQKFIDLVFGKQGCLNLNPSSVGNGKKHSKKTKEKISNSLTGKPITEETKAKISATKKGKTKTEEHKQKLSKSLKGHSVSEETKAKISATQKQRLALKKLKEVGDKSNAGL